MKLVVNTLLGVGMQAIAEAVVLGEKAGLDRERLLTVLSKTAVIAPAHVGKLAKAANNDYREQFPLRLMHKDIRLTLEAAKESRVKLPALETVEEIYEMATEDGHQDLDYAATLTLLEKWAGVQVKGKAA